MAGDRFRRVSWRRRRTRREVLGLSLLLTGGVLVGCGAAEPSSTLENGDLRAWPATDHWPARFRQASLEVQEAYRFAVAHPDVLRFMPCFCGCRDEGHTSNLDCHVAEWHADGAVRLDPMGFG